jgi:hypothetical protein
MERPYLKQKLTDGAAAVKVGGALAAWYVASASVLLVRCQWHYALYALNFAAAAAAAAVLISAGIGHLCS